MKRRTTLAAALAATTLVLTACGTSDDSNHDMSSMNGRHDMPGMGMGHDDGLSASKDGYTLQLRRAPMAGMSMPVSFAVRKDGEPVTAFETEQTKEAHFYLIRSDLSGFQHLHPTMAADGLWSTQPSPLAPGSYRLYVQVTPAGAKEPMVLSRSVTVDGVSTSERLPAASASTTVDGYRLTLSGPPTEGKELEVTVTKDGRPVVDLQPYLDTYAHVTAFREGNLAFAHLHPLNAVKGKGGPKLRFMVEIEETGTYRLFIQFMTGGVLHTAAVTTTVT